MYKAFSINLKLPLTEDNKEINLEGYKSGESACGRWNLQVYVKPEDIPAMDPEKVLVKLACVGDLCSTINRALLRLAGYNGDIAKYKTIAHKSVRMDLPLPGVVQPNQRMLTIAQIIQKLVGNYSASQQSVSVRVAIKNKYVYTVTCRKVNDVVIDEITAKLAQLQSNKEEASDLQGQLQFPSADTERESPITNVPAKKRVPCRVTGIGGTKAAPEVPEDLQKLHNTLGQLQPLLKDLEALPIPESLCRSWQQQLVEKFLGNFFSPDQRTHKNFYLPQQVPPGYLSMAQVYSTLPDTTPPNLPWRLLTDEARIELSSSVAYALRDYIRDNQLPEGFFYVQRLDLTDSKAAKCYWVHPSLAIFCELEMIRVLNNKKHHTHHAKTEKAS